MFRLFKHPTEAHGSTVPAILVGLFVSFGGVIFGYDTGTISGIMAMKYWKDHFSTGYRDSTGVLNVTASQQSLIVSILSAGTFFGALLSAPIADSVGRRWAMILDVNVFMFGVILQTVAVHIPLFSAGRFFAGLGVGLLSATIPLYQSETAPKWIRGAVVGCYQLSISIGMFLAAIVENETKNRSDSGSYRIPVAVQFAFGLILLVGMIILPETPRFLVRQGKHQAAAKSLSWLRRLDPSHSTLIEELAEIKDNNDYEMSIGSASYLACFQRPLQKRLLTGMVLQGLQQLTGVNFIYYYGTTYFQNSGISNPFLVTVIVDVISIFSVLSGVLMVEKWGRRPLLLFGAAGMAICHIIIASVAVALPGETQASKALIAFICFFAFFFNCSWGPCAWVVTGEMFPLKARGKALSMTTASNWLLNWALAYATPYMVNKGPGSAGLGSKVFFIWAGFCCLAAVFVGLYIYETKGLSLEEVDELYLKVGKAWKSIDFIPTMRFSGMADLKSDQSSPGSSAAVVDSTNSKSDLESDPSSVHLESAIGE